MNFQKNGFKMPVGTWFVKMKVENDLNCRKKQRQALLHWAYDSRLI